MVVNRVSTSIHSPGGQVASALATIWRWVLTTVSTLRMRWPLISSIRLNSSIIAWVSQRCYSPRVISAGGFLSATRPFGASCKCVPSSLASPPALD
jgi:hypothetical protein